MAFRSEYEIWQRELAGKRESRLGHLIAAAVGVALAVLLILFERAVLS